MTFRERAIGLIQKAIATGRTLGLEGEDLRDHIDMHFGQASKFKYSAEYDVWKHEVERLLAPPLRPGDRVFFEMLRATIPAIVIQELPPYKFTIKYLVTRRRDERTSVTTKNVLAAKLTRRTWPATIDTL